MGAGTINKYKAADTIGNAKAVHDNNADNGQCISTTPAKGRANATKKGNAGSSTREALLDRMEVLGGSGVCTLRKTRSMLQK